MKMIDDCDDKGDEDEDEERDPNFLVPTSTRSR